MAGVGNHKVQGIGEHAHDLLLHILRAVRQIDAVSQRFAHLRLAIHTGQPQTRRILRNQRLRLHQYRRIDAVELMHDLSGLFNHGQLILAHRNRSCLKCRDIRCLADGIGEKTHRDAGLEIPHLDLILYRGIALEPGHRHQIHIVKAKFRQLRDLGLDKQGRFGRIQPAG